MENKRLFCQVEVARHGEIDFGAGLSKRKVSLKKHSDRAQVHLFAVSMCQKSHRLGRLPWNTILHRNYTRLPSLGFKFLTYFSRVAGLLPAFVTSHTYRIY